MIDMLHLLGISTIRTINGEWALDLEAFSTSAHRFDEYHLRFGSYRRVNESEPLRLYAFFLQHVEQFREPPGMINQKEPSPHSEQPRCSAHAFTQPQRNLMPRDCSLLFHIQTSRVQSTKRRIRNNEVIAPKQLFDAIQFSQVTRPNANPVVNTVQHGVLSRDLHKVVLNFEEIDGRRDETFRQQYPDNSRTGTKISDTCRTFEIDEVA